MSKLMTLAIAVLAGLAIFGIGALTHSDQPKRTPTPAFAVVDVGPTEAAAGTDAHEEQEKFAPADDPTRLQLANRFLAAYVRLYACDQSRALWRELEATTSADIQVELQDSSPREGSGECSPLGHANDVQLFRRSARLWHALAAIPSQPAGRPLYFEISGSKARSARVVYIER